MMGMRAVTAYMSHPSRSQIRLTLWIIDDNEARINRTILPK